MGNKSSINLQIGVSNAANYVHGALNDCEELCRRRVSALSRCPDEALQNSL